MGALGAAEAQRLLNDSLRDGTKTYSIALFLTDPTRNGTGTEVSGGNYTRKAITFSAPTEVGGKQVVVNASDIDFGTMTATIGTVPYWAVYDNSNNLIFFGAFTYAKNVEVGDAIEIPAGEIKCILS